MTSQVGYLVAFGAGFVSFISPCVLPLIPGYISYITGLSLEELETGKDHIKDILLASLLFVAGFSLIFVLLGATASWGGSLLFKNRQLLNRLAGIFIIIMGLILMEIVKLPFLYQERRLQLKSSWGKVSSFPLGMAFAFGWTPCIGPILSAILGFAASVGSLREGAILLFFYSMGLGIPFILTALIMEKLVATFSWIKRHYRLINLVSGGILIVMGILLFFNRITYISILIQKILD